MPIKLEESMCKPLYGVIPRYYGFLPSSGCVHNSFSCALAKGIVELVAVVPAQVVTHEWLSSILVDSL